MGWQTQVGKVTDLSSYDLDRLTFPMPRPGEESFWGAHPADELHYDCFIRHALVQATREFARVVDEALWDDEPLGGSRHHLPMITNGIVDWTSETEAAAVLQHSPSAGWIDPDCLRVGGVSRVQDATRVLLAEVPGEINREYREWSFIALDAPTWSEERTDRAACLYEQVIRDLVDLQGNEDDTLYGWLERVFAFCAGNIVVYYSRYAPSPLIHAIGRAYRVRVVHLPLNCLAAPLRDRTASYRSMHLSVSQWRYLQRWLEEAGRLEEAALLQEHDVD